MWKRERERGMNLLTMKEGEKGNRDLMTSSGETKREREGERERERVRERESE